MADELHIPPVMRPRDSAVPPLYYSAPRNVNAHRHALLHNAPDLCAQHKDVFLLLVVKTTLEHAARRRAIRETWGAPYNMPNVVMPLVFMLGQCPVGWTGQGGLGRVGWAGQGGLGRVPLTQHRISFKLLEEAEPTFDPT